MGKINKEGKEGSHKMFGVELQYYDKNKSFFDNISCESYDRTSGWVKMELRNVIISFSWHGNYIFEQMFLLIIVNLKIKTKLERWKTFEHWNIWCQNNFPNNQSAKKKF